MVREHMVGVIIIAVVFTAIAGAIFWAAPRGRLDGVTNAMLSEKRGARAFINATLVVLYVGFGVVIPAIFLVGNGNNAGASVGGIKLTTSQYNGRQLFADHCAVCHTLADANAVGKTGPNLDQLKPSEPLILQTIANGCLSDPGASYPSETCRGHGVMPADIVQGQDAVDVAAFVARVAGHS